ncbi:hypothetical protein ANO11243_056610 [Dothideomycetidae sp. 11243]|nr:hypothetical protein ANO11243_056610 [fungal sp. No.11243]
MSEVNAQPSTSPQSRSKQAEKNKRMWDDIPKITGWIDFPTPKIIDLLPVSRPMGSIPGYTVCQNLHRIAGRYTMEKARRIFKSRLKHFNRNRGKDDQSRRLTVKELVEIAKGHTEAIDARESMALGTSSPSNPGGEPLPSTISEDAVGSVDGSGDLTSDFPVPRTGSSRGVGSDINAEDELVTLALRQLKVESEGLNVAPAGDKSSIKCLTSTAWKDFDGTFPSLQELCLKMENSPTTMMNGANLRQLDGSTVGSWSHFQSILRNLSGNLVPDTPEFALSGAINVFDCDVRPFLDEVLMNAFEKRARELVGEQLASQSSRFSSATFMHQESCTSIHHDTDTAVALARGGLNTKASEPLKIWLFTSEEYMSILVEHYGDTDAFLHAVVDAGGRIEYVIQRDNDLVIVPSNCPHAVYTFQRCYIYGPVWENPSQTLCLRAEAQGGQTVDKETYDAYLNKITRDLHGRHKIKIARQFCKYIELDKEFHKKWGKLELVEVLRKAMQSADESCFICEVRIEEGDWVGHICHHLDIKLRRDSRVFSSPASLRSGRLLRSSQSFHSPPPPDMLGFPRPRHTATELDSGYQYSVVKFDANTLETSRAVKVVALHRHAAPRGHGSAGLCWRRD